MSTMKQGDKSMTELTGFFDIHIDSNHRWDIDRVMEIDAYPLFKNAEGKFETDTTTTIASVRIPSLDFCVDTWISTNDGNVQDMPLHVRYAYNCIILIANGVQQQKALTRD